MQQLSLPPLRHGRTTPVAGHPYRAYLPLVQNSLPRQRERVGQYKQRACIGVVTSTKSIHSVGLDQHKQMCLRQNRDVCQPQARQGRRVRPTIAEVLKPESRRRDKQNLAWTANRGCRLLPRQGLECVDLSRASKRSAEAKWPGQCCLSGQAYNVSECAGER